MYFWSVKSISVRQAYMKTQPSGTICNALHILKLTEIACKSHTHDFEHLWERSKQENTKHKILYIIYMDDMAVA